jgi:putative Mn2+ efflux pump MntP
LAGVVSGAKTGASFGMKAGLYGGFILIGIGTKILAEHLFFGG